MLDWKILDVRIFFCVKLFVIYGRIRNLMNESETNEDLVCKIVLFCRRLGDWKQDEEVAKEITKWEINLLSRNMNKTLKEDKRLKISITLIFLTLHKLVLVNCAWHFRWFCKNIYLIINIFSHYKTLNTMHLENS